MTSEFSFPGISCQPSLVAFVLRANELSVTSLLPSLPSSSDPNNESSPPTKTSSHCRPSFTQPYPINSSIRPPHLLVVHHPSASLFQTNQQRSSPPSSSFYTRAITTLVSFSTRERILGRLRRERMGRLFHRPSSILRPVPLATPPARNSSKTPLYTVLQRSTVLPNSRRSLFANKVYSLGYSAQPSSPRRDTPTPTHQTLTASCEHTTLP